MQSERIEQRALHKHQQRGHLCAIQDKLLIFSLSHLLVHRPIEGTRVGGGKGDVHVPGVLSDGHNVPVLVGRGHAPVTKDGLDLFSRRDFAKEEEHLCVQWFCTKDVGVSGKRQGTQAAGWTKEERRHMVHLPESDLYRS
jgi:hypothetical protein